MILLPDYEKIIVDQKENYSCVPTGYEWIIRYLNILNVDLDKFQLEFNLQERGVGGNTFKGISIAIMSKYPHINIRVDKYEKDKADEKISKIKGLIDQKNPCLLSLAYPPNWHIVSVVGYDDENLIVHYPEFGTKSFFKVIKIKDVVDKHINCLGGNDLSWLGV